MDNVNQYVLFPADQTCITEQQKKSYQKKMSIMIRIEP